MCKTTNTDFKKIYKNEYARQFYDAKYKENDNMTSEEIDLVKENRDKRNSRRRQRYKEDKELRERQQGKARERYRQVNNKKNKTIKIIRISEENKV
tara:strand:- start:409 stop:696 length:288 start_codon:yes stop_codon:yes gene_type:complete